MLDTGSRANVPHELSVIHFLLRRAHTFVASAGDVNEATGHRRPHPNAGRQYGLAIERLAAVGQANLQIAGMLQMLQALSFSDKSLNSFDRNFHSKILTSC